MKRQIIIAAALCFLLVVAGCGGITGKTTEDTLKIGVAAPLTGHLSLFGERIQRGTEIAKDELNAQGGLNGRQVELVYEDTKCEPKQTQLALQKLKNIDDVSGIIGPFCGSSTQVAAEFAEENKIIVITPNNNYGKLSEMQFSLMSLVEVEDKVLAEYAFNEFGLRKVGIIYHDNFFGLLHRQNFRKYFEEFGGEITYEEGFDGSIDFDFRTSLLKIGRESDGIFIVYSRPGKIITQIGELDLDLQVLGQWGMENPITLREGGRYAEGTVYAFPSVIAEDDFKDKFNTKHGEEPSVTSAMSYDALFLMEHLFGKCQSFDNICASEEMQNLKNFEGASGTVNFNPDNWDIGKDFVIKTVKDQRFVKVRQIPD